jgi:Lon protease-like protein
MQRIPLFPLEVVLFPGAPLPLHIFEPRYKLMIGRCIERKEEFGMVLARDNGVVAVGCTAEILKVAKRYDDGRMDIATVGRRPFRIEALDESEEYLQGDVEFLRDDFTRVVAGVRTELVEIYERCYLAVHGQTPPTPEQDAESSLAFQIGGLLPLDLGSKQSLLEMRGEAERQEHLLGLLKESLPRLERMQRMKGKAGGNGHWVN